DDYSLVSDLHWSAFTGEALELVNTVIDPSSRANVLQIVEATVRADQYNLKKIGETRLKDYELPLYNWEEKLILNEGEEETALLKIDVIIDPVTELGQRIGGIINILHTLPNTFIRIAFKPSLDLTEIPIKRFYRIVFPTQLDFDENGDIKESIAVFDNIPKDLLLTMSVLVPQSWVVAPVHSPHDLDNLKLSKISGQVEAEYQLQHLLVQGHAVDSHNAPPRGTQFILTSLTQNEDLSAVPDTITMANLGYLQLKANPGVWWLRLRPGTSTSVYEFESVGGKKVINGAALVVLDSFKGVTLFPVVRNKPGMEGVDVLNVDDSKNKEGVRANINSFDSAWKFVSSMFPKPKNGSDLVPTKKQAEINIFSVASGHLYERFLGIMMLSVIRQTKSTVKFWLIENFLSPSFKEFLPHFAAVYDFDYELITYKWPHWLRAQTEKQRTIWGYKILFLDVLFPLSLEKVIFVDADQVVRVDMKELVDLDLNGAVYGYTPFCDSRKEMDGFRFWMSGYWKTHLQNRAYHI
ncbi:hypothetical protein HK096_006803, partial [Nowakowskiella sp. JEL0078]